MAAILLLIYSAPFIGYLAEAYGRPSESTSFAYMVGGLMGLIGIVMIFILEGWWGLVGIIGYWILIAISMAFWQKNITYRPLS